MQLAYTRQVIEETMRLYPPVSSLPGRKALGDDVVCGQPIRKGDFIGIHPWVVHRHRRLWDDPDRFDPERFAPDRVAARPRFAYLPFGAGPRICIGAGFAMIEAGADPRHPGATLPPQAGAGPNRRAAGGADVASALWDEDGAGEAACGLNKCANFSSPPHWGGEENETAKIGRTHQ